MMCRSTSALSLIVWIEFFPNWWITMTVGLADIICKFLSKMGRFCQFYLFVHYWESTNLLDCFWFGWYECLYSSTARITWACYNERSQIGECEKGVSAGGVKKKWNKSTSKVRSRWGGVKIEGGCETTDLFFRYSLYRLGGSRSGFGQKEKQHKFNKSAVLI